MIVNGKVVVVTGAGSGIGRDVVFALAAKGARIAAVDISSAALQETAALCRNHSDRISIHILDVTDRAAVSSLPDSVAREHGVIDGLVNVAGVIHRFARVNDLEFAEIERIMDINFYGVLNMTKAFLPVLLKRPQAHIASVSSMGSFVPVPGQTIYGASKAAVKLLMEGLHSELRDTNVGVTVVFPGAIATNIAVNSGAMTAAENAATAATMRMTPSPVAAAKLVRGIEKGSYHVFIGSDSVLLDKLSRLMPARAAKIIYSQMRDLLTDQPGSDRSA